MRARFLSALLCWGVLSASQGPLLARAGDREDWSKATAQPMAQEARPLMESILSHAADPEYAAQAGLWLGQLEYATGRVEAALPYFRQAAALAEDPGIRAQSAFWAEHCGSLLAGPSSDPDDGMEPASPTVTRASDFFRMLALGDAEIRSGRPVEALRRYLSLEGESRQLGLVGPLAYRVALVVAFARSAGETDPLFSWKTLDSWESELARSPERGLITALRRRDESLPSLSKNREFQAATDFAELPGPAPKNRRVSNRSFPAPDFSPPDSLDSDYREGGESRSRPGRGGRGKDLATGQSEAGRDPSDRPSLATRYVIALGAFGERDAARREMERLTSRGLSVRLEPGWADEGGRVYRIFLGQPAPREQQESIARQRLVGLDYQIVPVDP